MKRIIAITLLLCLLLSFAAPALAQTRPLRFLVNDNGEAAAWLKEHYPEIPSQNLHSDYDYSPGEYDSLTDRLLGELESGDGPDLYLLDSNAYDLARVLGSGLVEDLSGNEDIRRGVSQQYEPFQRFVSGEDGAIYGMFERVHGSPTLIDPAAWEAAGLEAVEAPRSYEELLDFAGKWTELVKAGSVGNVRLNTIQFAGYPRDERRYTLWLTGPPVALLGHAAAGGGRGVPLQHAGVYRPGGPCPRAGPRAGPSGKKAGAASLSLYINGGNVRYGPEDFYTNAFPMRLTADEPSASAPMAFSTSCERGAPTRRSAGS